MTPWSTPQELCVGGDVEPTTLFAEQNRVNNPQDGVRNCWLMRGNLSLTSSRSTMEYD